MGVFLADGIKGLANPAGVSFLLNWSGRFEIGNSEVLHW